MTRITAIFLMVLPFQIHAEILCGENTDAGELSISEMDLNLEKAQWAIRSMKEELPETVSLNPGELHLGYLNRLKVIQGTLKKQNVLLLKYKYLNSNISEDEVAYERALDEFCEYISDAIYID